MKNINQNKLKYLKSNLHKDFIFKLSYIYIKNIKYRKIIIKLLNFFYTNILKIKIKYFNLNNLIYI